jgi:hypothetical protein
VLDLGHVGGLGIAPEHRARLRAGGFALEREGLSLEPVVGLSARPAAQRLGAAAG